MPGSRNGPNGLRIDLHDIHRLNKTSGDERQDQGEVFEMRGASPDKSSGRDEKHYPITAGILLFLFHKKTLLREVKGITLSNQHQKNQ